MIDTLIGFAGSLFLISGALVVVIGGIGMLRLPDFFCRIHSVGVIDTLGAWLVLIGLIILSPDLLIAFKVLMIAVLLYFLSPVSSHILAKIAIESRDGMKNDSGIS